MSCKKFRSAKFIAPSVLKVAQSRTLVLAVIRGQKTSSVLHYIFPFVRITIAFLISSPFLSYLQEPTTRCLLANFPPPTLTWKSVALLQFASYQQQHSDSRNTQTWNYKPLLNVHATLQYSGKLLSKDGVCLCSSQYSISASALNCINPTSSPSNSVFLSIR